MSRDTNRDLAHPEMTADLALRIYYELERRRQRRWVAWYLGAVVVGVLPMILWQVAAVALAVPPPSARLTAAAVMWPCFVVTVGTLLNRRLTLSHASVRLLHGCMAVSALAIGAMLAGWTPALWLRLALVAVTYGALWLWCGRLYRQALMGS